MRPAAQGGGRRWVVMWRQVHHQAAIVLRSSTGSPHTLLSVITWTVRCPTELPSKARRAAPQSRTLCAVPAGDPNDAADEQPAGDVEADAAAAPEPPAAAAAAAEPPAEAAPAGDAWYSEGEEEVDVDDDASGDWLDNPYDDPDWESTTDESSDDEGGWAFHQLEAPTDEESDDDDRRRDFAGEQFLEEVQRLAAEETAGRHMLGMAAYDLRTTSFHFQSADALSVVEVPAGAAGDGRGLLVATSDDAGVSAWLLPAAGDLQSLRPAEVRAEVVLILLPLLLLPLLPSR